MYSKKDDPTNIILVTLSKITAWFKFFAIFYIEVILFYLAIVLFIGLFPLLGNPSHLLSVLDQYMKLVLNSWPIVGLTLGLSLVITQHDSIDEFIRKRMTKAGPAGVEGSVLNPQVSQAALNEADSLGPSSNTTETDTQDGVRVRDVAVTENENFPTVNNPIDRESMDQIQELSKELELERIYNTIFGTQISVLVWLRNNVSGLWYAALANVYEQWREKDETLKNYSLDNYIAFLVANKLIRPIEEPGGRKFYISDYGLDFLNFIERRGYSNYKPH